MKKFVTIVLALVLAAGSVSMLSACTPRSEKLIILNWENYIDEDIYEGFEDYYKKETGKSINVEPSPPYDACETLYDLLTQRGGDYDLICTSDYMLERLIKEGWLEDINAYELDAFNNISESLKGLDFDKNNDYTIPFSYGTLGIMYNETVITDTIDSWEYLWESGKPLYIKDSKRDAYAVASIYNSRAGLAAAAGGTWDYDLPAYAVELEKAMNNVSVASLAAAETSLKTLVKTNSGNDFSTDADTELMLEGEGLGLGIFWSCDAGYAMMENQDLWYTVPKEGGNLWLDSFAVPKNAVNKDIAIMFIEYISQPEVAFANIEPTGISSAVKDAADEFLDSLDELFPDVSEEWLDMFIDTMYPSEETLKRCAIMKNFSNDMNAKLNDMFSSVHKAA